MYFGSYSMEAIVAATHTPSVPPSVGPFNFGFNLPANKYEEFFFMNYGNSI